MKKVKVEETKAEKKPAKKSEKAGLLVRMSLLSISPR